MNLLVVSGGRHPYEESTPILQEFLTAAGLSVTVTEDASLLADSDGMAAYDALVFNTLREGDSTLTDAEQNNMKEYVSGGKGFVCIHISGCVPETWPGYSNMTGGGWKMSKSFHPPYGRMTANVTDPDNPGALGISDFETNDELYMGVDYEEGNDVYITGTSEDGWHTWRGEEMFMPGGTFPLGWTRSHGEGKVFVTLLGHDGQSFQTPEFQRIVLNGVDWVTS